MLNRVALCIIAICLFVSSLTTSSLADRKQNQKTIDLMQQINTHQSTPGIEESTYFNNITISSREAGDFETKIKKEYPGLSLNRSAAYAVAAYGQIGIYIPVAGAAKGSVFGMWFDEKSGLPISTMNSLYINISNKTIHAKVELNGKLRLDAIFGASGQILSGVFYEDTGIRHILKTTQGEMSATGFYDCFKSCLLDTWGVPAYVIGTIAIMCELACVLTVGYGCLPCLYIAAAGFTVPMEWCFYHCW